MCKEGHVIHAGSGDMFIEKTSSLVTADDMEGRIITHFGGLVLMWLGLN